MLPVHQTFGPSRTRPALERATATWCAAPTQEPRMNELQLRAALVSARPARCGWFTSRPDALLVHIKLVHAWPLGLA